MIVVADAFEIGIGVVAVLVGMTAVALGWAGWHRHATARKGLSALRSIDSLLATGDDAAAADAVITSLATHTESHLRVELRRRLARILVGREEYAEAIRVCEQALSEAEDDDGRYGVRADLARALAEQGNVEAALEALSPAHGSDVSPDVRVAVAMAAADCAMFLSRLDDAERHLADAFAQAGRGAFAPEVGLGHARLQFLRGNFKQAVAEIGRVLEQLPGDDLQALALVTLARALLDQEHPDAVGADHALSRAAIIVRHPGLAAVVAGAQALLQAHFRNFADAERDAARAPGSTLSVRRGAEARCLAGDALRFAGKFLEARAAYQTALLDYPRMPEALYGLARCAQAFGLFEVAESYFRLCIEAAPGHILASRSEAALEI